MDKLGKRPVAFVNFAGQAVLGAFFRNCNVYYFPRLRKYRIRDLDHYKDVFPAANGQFITMGWKLIGFSEADIAKQKAHLRKAK